MTLDLKHWELSYKYILLITHSSMDKYNGLDTLLKRTFYENLMDVKSEEDRTVVYFLLLTEKEM